MILVASKLLCEIVDIIQFLSCKHKVIYFSKTGNVHLTKQQTLQKSNYDVVNVFELKYNYALTDLMVQK